MSGNIYISGKSSNNKITISGSGENKDINLSTKEANNNLATLNNNAKYYSDKALESANKAEQQANLAKGYAESVVETKNELLSNEDFKTAVTNIDKINIVSENIENVITIAEDLESVADNLDVINNVNDNLEVITNINTNIKDINTVTSNIKDIQNAEENANIAKEKAQESANYSELSKQWAISSELVENIDYSSKHYAEVSKEQADISTSKTNEVVQKGNTALKNIEANSTNAKNEISTLKTNSLEEITNIKNIAISDIETLADNTKTEIEVLGNEKIDIVTVQTEIAITKASEASQSANNALKSAENSALSEASAKKSENNTKASETNAKTSEQNAKSSELKCQEIYDRLGVVIKLKGRVDSIEDLPTTNVVNGDAYLVGVAGLNSYPEYYWYEDHWEYMGSTEVKLEWGGISGTLSNQTDLQAVLDGKVSLSGTETITGQKTFEKDIIINGANVDIKPNSGDGSIRYTDDARIRFTQAGATVISSYNTALFLRTKSNRDGTNQVTLNTDGTLSATKFKGPLDGIATQATKDSNGLQINTNYMRKTIGDAGIPATSTAPTALAMVGKQACGNGNIAGGNLVALHKNTLFRCYERGSTITCNYEDKVANLGKTMCDGSFSGHYTQINPSTSFTSKPFVWEVTSPTKYEESDVCRLHIYSHRLTDALNVTDFKIEAYIHDTLTNSKKWITAYEYSGESKNIAQTGFGLYKTGYSSNPYYSIFGIRLTISGSPDTVFKMSQVQIVASRGTETLADSLHCLSDAGGKIWGNIEVTGTINGKCTKDGNGNVIVNTYATKTELNAKQDKGNYALKSEIPTNNNQLINGAGYITSDYHDNTKQDVISDLAIIRSGASKGATALQSVPAEYVTETELNAKGYLTKHQDISHLATKTEVTNGLATKANDNTVVHKTGNETISGDKTFSNTISAENGKFGKKLTTYRYNANESPTTTYYWYKIFQSSTSSQCVNFEIMAHSDNNYPQFAKYSISVSNYRSTSTSIVVYNHGKIGSTPNIKVAIDADGNVYLQANCVWDCVLTANNVYGNATVPYTNMGYSGFGTPIGFTSIGMITSTGAIRYLKTTGTVTYSTPEIDALATKATADASGNNIVDTYLTKSSASSTYAAKATTLSGYGITNAYTKSDIDSYLNNKLDKTGTATKATSDANGNNIVNTYATKTELTSKQDILIPGENITIENNVISAKNDSLSIGTTPIGTIIPLNASSNYVPDGCLPCDGAEYTKAQFGNLWDKYLTSKEFTTIATPANFLTLDGLNLTKDGLLSGFNGTNYLKFSVNNYSNKQNLSFGFTISMTDVVTKQTLCKANSTNVDELWVENGNFVYKENSGAEKNLCEAIANTKYQLKFQSVGDGFSCIIFKDNDSIGVTSGGNILFNVTTSECSFGQSFTSGTIYLTESFYEDNGNKTYLATSIIFPKGLLNTCTYSEYQEDITTYGQCSKFAIDTDNEKFRVPLIKDGAVVQQALSDSELGKSYNAGLPNIEGSFPTEGTSWQSGAFYYTGTSGSSGATGSDGNHNKMGFDASRSNAIYGNSDTVQMNAVALRYFVVVANGQTNQSMMDWGAWASSLQGKANADLSNVNFTQSVKSKVISWGLPDYSQPTTISASTEYLAESDLRLIVTDITAHDDTHLVILITYKGVQNEFRWGGYSSSTDKQRDCVSFDIPKGATFKITQAASSTMRTYPFIGNV